MLGPARYPMCLPWKNNVYARYFGVIELMCGFTGVLSRVDWASNAEQLLMAMGSSISHRGPNDKGVWFDKEAGIGFAHTRLSIVDLSPAGHQPMVSASGQYVIAFNGEIYNHLALRQELECQNWRGHSDTETLLAGFDAWGVENTLKRSVGMFAFALWDKKSHTLILGRDRAGEKPLYYGWHGNFFLFGSELKALKTHPAFKSELNGDAIAIYLSRSYIPAPLSIYKNIEKLMPGSLLHISLDKPEPVLKSYWLAVDKAMDAAATPFKGDTIELVDELERITRDAVTQQMIADVPLGAFLSGGIDSSTVVALMQTQSSIPVRTFSIGFHEKKYNEAPYAKEVATHLGTNHTELYIDNEDALAVIPKLSTLYDEPFADSSQIPTYLISHLAKQKVTVALTGDGGDELFCGYNRYQMASRLWGKIHKIPMPIRKSLSTVIEGVNMSTWDRMAAVIPFAPNIAAIGSKLHKGAKVLTSSDVNQLYSNFINQHQYPEALLRIESKQYNSYLDPKTSSLHDIERMMFSDFTTYLPDDILVKVDRAAMGVSLETRVPFLDHRVVEFAWSLPINKKFHEGKTKWPLRQLLYRHVPEKLIERPKMGFGIPLGEWLRGPLKMWAQELLDENRLVREGIFNPDPVRAMWTQHLQGRGNFAYVLWNILMFQAWLEIQG